MICSSLTKIIINHTAWIGPKQRKMFQLTTRASLIYLIMISPPVLTVILHFFPFFLDNTDRDLKNKPKKNMNIYIILSEIFKRMGFQVEKVRVWNNNNLLR